MAPRASSRAAVTSSLATASSRPTTSRSAAVGPVLGRQQVVPEADQALADPVVDLPRQPPPLVLLGLDGAGGEALQHLLPLGQALVEAGVLDGPGHEVGHLGEQGQVVGPVVAGLLGVDVEHADHPPAPGMSIGTDTMEA